MKVKYLSLFLVFILAGALITVVDYDVVKGSEPEYDYEVWAADQGTNKIHILDGNTHEVKDIIDLNGIAETPHMIVFDSEQKYAYVANMGSGDISVIRIADREVITTLPTEPGAHAAIPVPGGKKALVANTPSQSITEVLIDAETETFTAGRTIKLDEHPLLADSSEFPNRNPICQAYTLDGSKAFVTIGGGGLVVLDVEKLDVIKAYGKSIVGPNGCGLALSPDGKQIYANSGTVNDGYYYVFDTETNDLVIKAPTQGLDAHGVAFTIDQKQLLIANRVSDDLTFLDTKTQRITDKIDFVGDAPDLVVVSPDNKYAYITLRGPEPATGTHALSGQTPGVSVVDLKAKKLVKHIALEEEPVGSDPHGIALRVISAPPFVPEEEKPLDERLEHVVEGDLLLVLNGKTVILKVPVQASNGERFVSVRPVVEALGGTIVWNQDDKSIEATIEDTTITFQLGSAEAKVNGTAITLASKVYTVDGISQVPASALFEHFGIVSELPEFESPEHKHHK